MKKWIAGLAAALITGTAAVYIFIPSSIRIRKVMLIRANDKGIYPFIQQQQGLARWWPGEIKDGKLLYKGAVCTMPSPLLYGAATAISRAGQNVTTELQVIPLNIDSLEVVWSAAIPGGADPFSRIANYRNAAAIKTDMENILLSLRSFLEKMENIYDIRVERTKVRDTLLLTTQLKTTQVPDNETISGLVKQLEAHTAAGGAAATNPPLLNIYTEDSINYKTMVALPISREVTETEQFKIKRMVPGNVLVTEIKGGPVTIRHSLQQLDRYRNNYNYTAPAKPYQAMVTNRITETDTAKWITKLYWPVY